MAKISDQQIARHVIDAGFVGEQRAVGVAIVLAESAGDTDAMGDTTIQTDVWGPSVGLFQIRSLHVDKGTGRARDQLANLDPGTNARHARIIFLERQAWTPWSTFLHNSYLHHMQRARTAVEAAGGAGQIEDGSGTHVVRSGETLGGIARMHGLSIQQLEALNPVLFNAAHKGGNLVHPGEIVILSATVGGRATAPTGVHIVVDGDTLGRIATDHGLTLARVRKLNPNLFDARHRNGNRIFPGELVRLT